MGVARCPVAPPPYIGAVIPLFTTIGLGFVFRKATKVQIGPLIGYTINIGAPFLVFNQLYTAELGVEAARMVMAAAATLLGITLLSWLVLKGLGDGPVGPALLPSVLPNAGNMGLPLVTFAFGEKALPLAIAYFIVSSLYTNTVGVFLAASDRSREGLMGTLRLPLIYAALAGFLLNQLQVQLPYFLQNTIKLIGDTAVPLLLITLGAKLAEIGGDINVRGSIASSVLRLAGGFLVGLLVAHGLGMGGLERKVLVLQSSMPSAVFSYLLSERFQARPELASSTVVITTTASLFTIPALLLYLA